MDTALALYDAASANLDAATELRDELITVVREDAPAQTGSDRLLKLMNRGYTIAEYDEFCAPHAVGA